MIKLLGKLPKNVIVATSGGVDSMALLDFLNNNHTVCAAFFHHGTDTSHTAHEFLREYLAKRDIPLIIGRISVDKPKEHSSEEHWRNCRYDFFKSLNGVVATAHNLNDCVETWLWGSMHGQPKIIPQWHANVVRPLLLTEKKDLYAWCNKKNVPWIEDESNKDNKYMRNYIRNEMMPHVLKVNPGIFKTIRRKVLDKYGEID